MIVFREKLSFFFFFFGIDNEFTLLAFDFEGLISSRLMLYLFTVLLQDARLDIPSVGCCQNRSVLIKQVRKQILANHWFKC